MAADVNPKRAYNSPRRQEQAAATRRSILTAALRLFERQGYPATTMEAIAGEAGVALKTVYLAFDTKSGLLRAVWDLALKGDESDAPVGARPWYLEVLDEPDPERQLRLNARNAVVVKRRIGALLAAIRDAAPTEPDTAALWALIQTDFYENQRRIVESLAAKGALAPGLDVTCATDLLWTFNHPDVWLLLTRERGWTAEAFEQWFADSCCAQLLASPVRARRSKAAPTTATADGPTATRRTSPKRKGASKATTEATSSRKPTAR